MAHVSINLSRSEYPSGDFRQWCPRCNADKISRFKEIDFCPDCHQAIEPADFMDIGGVAIQYEANGGGRYELSSSGAQNAIVINAADIKTVLLFMLRRLPAVQHGDFGPVNADIITPSIPPVAPYPIRPLYHCNGRECSWEGSFEKVEVCPECNGEVISDPGMKNGSSWFYRAGRNLRIRNRNLEGEVFVEHGNLDQFVYFILKEFPDMVHYISPLHQCMVDSLPLVYKESQTHKVVAEQPSNTIEQVEADRIKVNEMTWPLYRDFCIDQGYEADRPWNIHTLFEKAHNSFVENKILNKQLVNAWIVLSIIAAILYIVLCFFIADKVGPKYEAWVGVIGTFFGLYSWYVLSSRFLEHPLEKAKYERFEKIRWNRFKKEQENRGEQQMSMEAGRKRHGIPEGLHPEEELKAWHQKVQESQERLHPPQQPLQYRDPTTGKVYPTLVAMYQQREKDRLLKDRPQSDNNTDTESPGLNQDAINKKLNDSTKKPPHGPISSPGTAQ